MFTPGTKEEMAATYKALAGTGNDIIVTPKYILQIEKHLFVKKQQLPFLVMALK